MPSKEDAIKAVEKHGSKAAAAKALGVPRTTLVGWLAGTKPAPRAAEGAPKTGKSLGEFRNLYDKATIVPKRIDAALKALGGGWDYEIGFAKLAGVSMADLGHFRDQYAAHVVQLNRDSRRAWAGSAATAQKMRTMLGIAS